jgi:hypothetical protein
VSPHILARKDRGANDNAVRARGARPLNTSRPPLRARPEKLDSLSDRIEEEGGRADLTRRGLRGRNRQGASRGGSRDRALNTLTLTGERTVSQGVRLGTRRSGTCYPWCGRRTRGDRLLRVALEERSNCRLARNHVVESGQQSSVQNVTTYLYPIGLLLSYTHRASGTYEIVTVLLGASTTTVHPPASSSVLTAIARGPESFACKQTGPHDARPSLVTKENIHPVTEGLNERVGYILCF